MDGITGPSSVDQLKAPYAERWGLLKGVMVRLYMDEEKQVKDIAKIMEAEYKFYASSVLIIVFFHKSTLNANCVAHAVSTNTNVNSAFGT